MFSKDVLHLWVLGGLLATGGFGFMGARQLMLPKNWGDGYRAELLRAAASRPHVIATSAECLDCHAAVAEKWSDGGHKSVQCVVCHGIAREHVDDCRRVKAAGGGATACQKAGVRPKEARAVCETCHAKTVGRPETWKQVDVAAHLDQYQADDPKGKSVCKSCHTPHAPAEPPEEAPTP